MLILLSIFNIYKIMEVEMDKLFKLKENNTSVRTEVVAGITTFMTMAYILAVNPSILSASGMDSNAILMATAIASAIGCFAMAFLANYPFALAPGLGLNAYFAYTVCGSMGYSWKVALFAVFVEGLVFIVLSLTNVREAIFNAIPTTLKKGVSVGIGLFVAFIGVKTLKLDIPLVPETRINWAFVSLHITIIYILKLCLDEEIIPRCRFPYSRGYLTKCINWQKKQ